MRRILTFFLICLFAAGPTAVAAKPCFPLTPAVSVAEDCMSAMTEKHEVPVQTCNERCAAMLGVAAVLPLAPPLAIPTPTRVRLSPRAALHIVTFEEPVTVRPPRTIA